MKPPQWFTVCLVWTFIKEERSAGSFTAGHGLRFDTSYKEFSQGKKGEDQLILHYFRVYYRPLLIVTKKVGEKYPIPVSSLASQSWTTMS